MKIIQQRDLKTAITYHHSFSIKGNPGCGYVFDCDKDGNPTSLKSEAAKANYALCLSGFNSKGEALVDDGVEERECRWFTDRIGLCECGEQVYLNRFTNTCDCCNRDYNASGQELAPREQWFEGTDECWSDIQGL